MCAALHIPSFPPAYITRIQRQERKLLPLFNLHLHIVAFVLILIHNALCDDPQNNTSRIRFFGERARRLHAGQHFRIIDYQQQPSSRH